MAVGVAEPSLKEDRIMSINPISVAVVAVSLGVMLGDAGAQTETAKGAEDPVVAIVNGAEIHRSDVILAQRQLPAEARSYPLELIYPRLLDRVIDSKLFTLEARKDNLQDDADVKTRMARIEDQVIQMVYLERYVARVVTDEALRQRFDEFLKLNPPQDQVRARHILVETEAEAEALIEAIEGGADFAQLAAEKSTGPSAEQGGELDYFARDDVVAGFAEAAFGLEPGEVTDQPVKTQFGWHVIKVEDRRRATPPTFEETRDRLTEEMSQEAYIDLVERLRLGARIERFNLDGAKPAE